MATYFRTDGWVKSALGAAVPGALIYVCAPQPANVDFLPPTPLAPIYSDANGLVPVTQPIVTDGFGHYDFYAVPGIYTVVVVNAGTVQQVYPDQSVGNVGTGTSNTSGLVPGNNITIIGNVISAVASGESLTLQTNGVPNTNQGLLNLFCSDGSITLANIAGSTNIKAVPQAAPPLASLFTSIHGWSSYANGSNFSGTQQLGAVPQGGSFSVVAPTATEGPLMITEAGVTTQVNEGADAVTLGWLNTLWHRTAMLHNTIVQTWYGLCPFADVSALYTDLPTFNVVAFRYCTDAGDTTFKAYCGSSPSANTIVDTGVVADTNPHTFMIKPTNGGSTVTFYIDGNLVATISTNVPSISFPLCPVLFQASVGFASSDRQLKNAYTWWIGNN